MIGKLIRRMLEIGRAARSGPLFALFVALSPFWSHELINSCLLILQISSYTFVSPLASSMMAPGIPEVAIKYGITNPTIIALTLSIFLLSFASGVSSRLPFLSDCDLCFLKILTQPFILAPLSEMYGRTWVRLQTPKRPFLTLLTIGHLPSRSSISAICLRWRSVWDARSRQIRVLSLVSVFSVSVHHQRQSHFLN
jgi:hypothetical protein